jgi:hypothetical protein
MATRVIKLPKQDPPKMVQEVRSQSGPRSADLLRADRANEGAYATAEG